MKVWVVVNKETDKISIGKGWVGFMCYSSKESLLEYAPSRGYSERIHKPKMVEIQIEGLEDGQITGI